MEDENFWLVFILKDRTSNVSFNVPKLNIENLLIEPAMVAQFFWNSGVFFNVGKIEIPSELDYGFYRIGKGYVDEYGRALEQEPKLMGTYGVSSKDGLAYEINYELIANNIMKEMMTLILIEEDLLVLYEDIKVRKMFWLVISGNNF